MRDKYEAEMRRINKVSNANRPEGYHTVKSKKKIVWNTEPFDDTKPQHTPTPWKMTSDICIVTDEEKPLHLGGMARFDDAAYIVKAVNCHEELLAWVKQVHNHEHQPMRDCPTCELIAKAEGK